MRKYLPYIGAAVTAVLFGLLLLLLWDIRFFSTVSNLEEAQIFLAGFAPYTQIVFFFIQLMSVIIAPIPSNITAVAGATVIGALQSFLITTAAVYLGSFIMFMLARKFGKKFAEKFISEKLSDKYKDIIRTKSLSFIILAFIFPFFPDDLICLMAGLTNLSLKKFMVIVVLTRPWGIFAASVLGGSLSSLLWWQIAILGVVILLLFVFGMTYGDKIEGRVIDWYRKKRGREDDEE